MFLYFNSVLVSHAALCFFSGMFGPVDNMEKSCLGQKSSTTLVEPTFHTFLGEQLTGETKSWLGWKGDLPSLVTPL